MLQKMRAKQRHTRLMRVAGDLIDPATRKASRPEDVTTAQVACLAFARYQLRIDEDEAADYLAAALVAHGYSTEHRPATAV
ncbi:hypothetical protein EF914_24945 [Streptomyces sp. WAC05458]|uniref:hypothetical protein n=1 Tax=Streptomyces sp. WAC05458 TaxID=2487412 RepID=UPI000F9640AB|nr:hypothetical protein [Streptomyces sp. WAC05458]RSS17477.1 hypothetical protein EF914_24945 [Streptomyces sp. WAC05458]